MIIDFFQTENGLEHKAVKGGVYLVELVDKNNETNNVPLYIGESTWMAARCSQHLFTFINGEYEYFGLREEDYNNNNLILRFRVLKDIAQKKSIRNKRLYKNMEMEYIQDIKPLTQLITSDRQINKDEKIRKVQDKMKELKMK